MIILHLFCIVIFSVIFIKRRTAKLLQRLLVFNSLFWKGGKFICNVNLEQMYRIQMMTWLLLVFILYQVDQFSLKIDWFPEYIDLRSALDTYGFLFKFSSSAEHERSGINWISSLVCLYIMMRLIFSNERYDYIKFQHHTLRCFIFLFHLI
jgi:hypothetical protein